MADQKISQLPNATTPLAGTEVLPIVQGGTTDKVTVANLTAGRAVSASSVELTGGTVNGVAYLDNSKVLTTSSALEFNGSNVLLRGNELIAFNTYTNATLHAGYIRRNTATANMEIAAQTIGSNYAINFLTSNTIRVTVAAAGDVTLNTGNIIQGTAAKGVNFTANTPAAGMTSQLLNWYEEGTFTPTILFGGGGTGITYSVQDGRYVRIGRQVTVEGKIALSNKGSSTGAVTIQGFPFTSNAKSYASQVIDTLSAFNGLTAGGCLFAIISQSSTFAYIMVQGTANRATVDDTYFNNNTQFTFQLTYTV